jgi:hypothetical protein
MGFSKESHVHTWVSVMISVYRVVQVSRGAVSTTSYFYGSLSGLRDDINNSRS